MDAMQNESATAVDVENADAVEAEAEVPKDADSPTGEKLNPETAPNATPDGTPEQATEAAAESIKSAESAPEPATTEQSTDEVPQPRTAEPEPATAEANSSKGGKKRKAAPKPKSAAGTKSLVVFREGKVHYADETVVVLDLDDAAHPDTDVHDVVDKLSELRDAIESSGRSEAVSLVAELIQAKALA